jgi:hypothetical protein
VPQVTLAECGDRQQLAPQRLAGVVEPHEGIQFDSPASRPQRSAKASRSTPPERSWSTRKTIAPRPVSTFVRATVIPITFVRPPVIRPPVIRPPVIRPPVLGAPILGAPILGATLIRMTFFATTFIAPILRPTFIASSRALLCAAIGAVAIGAIAIGARWGVLFAPGGGVW